MNRTLSRDCPAALSRGPATAGLPFGSSPAPGSITGAGSIAGAGSSAEPVSLADAVIEWFRDNSRDLPWRRDGFSAWGTLVSEFMLQQTPVVRVIPRLQEWLERWPTPSGLAAASPGDAVRAWKSLGYPRRALWLHACAVTITEQHDGRVPSDVVQLLALPGVGDYTARAVAVFAYGLRHPVVDTNIRRVIARAVAGQGHPGLPSSRRDLSAMEALLPVSDASSAAFNAGFMELGAVVCTANSPRCGACPIRDDCAWRRAGYPAFEGKRPAAQKRFEGSDRQVRGLILALLRSAHSPVAATAIEAVWPETRQRDRAVASLLADGLATRTGDYYALPAG